MPAQSDNYDPTDEDVDMTVEEATGKPVKPGNPAADIASMQRRIVQLEKEKTKLLNQMDGDAGGALEANLAAVNKDLAIARERLVRYEEQARRTN